MDKEGTQTNETDGWSLDSFVLRRIKLFGVI